jgi:predicted transcriptional regulator
MSITLRTSVTLDPRSAKRLEKLSADDEDSKSAVIRQALALEDLFREVNGEGGKMLVKRSDGTIAEVVRP